MTAIRSLDDLNKFREEVVKKKAQIIFQGNIRVVVSMGSCGIAAGASDTLRAIIETVKRDSLRNVLVSQTGCGGLCSNEPVIQVIIDDQHKVTYGKVTPEVAKRIIKEHVHGNRVVQDYVIET
jgi:NADP-reducing hydrogenase subunit HndB